MPKMQAMRLTEAAADRVRDLVLASGKDSAGLRVGVTKGGCAGIIDAKAVLYLLGTEMDYVTDKLSARFVFNNPNQTSACGCGESIALTPARPEALGTA